MNSEELKKKKALIGPMLAFLSGTIIAQAVILILLKAQILNFFVALALIVIVTGGAIGSIFAMVMHMMERLAAMVEGESVTNTEADAKLEKLAARQDDLGLMVRNVQSYITNMGTLLHSMREAAVELGDVSKGLEESFATMTVTVDDTENCMADISKNVESQGVRTDDMKSRIESINVAIDEIIKNIDLLNSGVDHVRDCNTNAEEIMSELVKLSNENNEAMKKVKLQTEKTNASVNEIQAATDIITGIAAQTNLLALNASIEAARAGEMGKGFAVVADEIRILADQSKSSAGQIASVVNTLMENSRTSVTITDQVAASFGEQIEKITATEKIFGDLNREVKSLTSSISDIDKEVKGLSGHKNNLDEGIEALTASSLENAGSVNKAAEHTNVLRENVQNCDEMKNRTVTVVGNLTECMSKLSGMRMDVESLRKEAGVPLQKVKTLKK